jgi:ElaB/YqjD/DUF883 family membrane-anchored ribosome-binding protein
VEDTKFSDPMKTSGRFSVQPGTAANFSLDQTVLNDEALSSGVDVQPAGPDLAAIAQDRLAQLTSRARETAEALQARGVDFARVAKKKAEQNPWIAIAAASASALAVGLIVGRLLKPKSQDVGEEYPSGYIE